MPQGSEGAPDHISYIELNPRCLYCGEAVKVIRIGIYLKDGAVGSVHGATMCERHGRGELKFFLRDTDKKKEDIN